MAGPPVPLLPPLGSGHAGGACLGTFPGAGGGGVYGEPSGFMLTVFTANLSLRNPLRTSLSPPAALLYLNFSREADEWISTIQSSPFENMYFVRTTGHTMCVTCTQAHTCMCFCFSLFFSSSFLCRQGVSCLFLLLICFYFNVNFALWNRVLFHLGFLIFLKSFCCSQLCFHISQIHI